MSDETSDFIMADETERRIILIHAKASSSYKPYSASAIQEVCSQAQKNTTLFSTYSLQEPGNLGRWDDAHRFTGTGKVSLEMKGRLRYPGGLSAAEVWDRLRALLLDPLADKEVWLVLGNMLSAAGFADNMKREDPEPEALQLNHLLTTTMAAVNQVNAKLRVFCAP
jgi:hypothetical protein